MQTQSKSEMQTEALDRAKHGQSLTNYAAIYSGFMAKGIAEADIKPRENVFTFNAWKALGRSVKKGEHGVKVVTFINVDGDEDPATGEKTDGYRLPKTTTVFHISQTQETTEQQKQLDANRNAARQDRQIGAGFKSGFRRRWSNRPRFDSDTGKDYGEHMVRDPGEDAADRWTESNR